MYIFIFKNAAVDALPFYCDFYQNNEEAINTKLKVELINKYISNLNTSKEFVRSGYTLALGNLARFVLKNNSEIVLKSLIEMAKITPNTVLWVESRKDAIRSIMK